MSVCVDPPLAFAVLTIEHLIKFHHFLRALCFSFAVQDMSACLCLRVCVDPPLLFVPIAHHVSSIYVHVSS